jgi:DNA ligase 1
MLLADLVTTSEAVAATRSRSAKVASLAALLAGQTADDVEVAVAFLAGEPRQGKVGVGWAALAAAMSAASPAADATLTVAEVDAAIADLKARSGPGSTGQRQALLTALLDRATAAESDFLRRLLLGDLRQGALESVVTDAVARASGIGVEAVRRAVMLAGNLSHIARLALSEGLTGLEAVGLEVLRPVQPMLAATSADVAGAIAACGPSSVEWKLDGARIQAHRAGNEVRLFTRNLNDVTSRLPGAVSVVRSLPVERVILDGEVLGVGDDERPDRFQETMSRFGRHEGRGRDLGVWFFDCLHVDGVDLIDEPLGSRQEVLERIAGPWRVPATRTDDPAVAAAFLEASLEAGHEGVMVKSIDSRYEAGRRGQAWRKVKPVQTFDLVVLAAEWGHGRRQGWLSNLHLGARSPDGGFVMVGKTFKGLTDELLTWQTARFLELETARHQAVVEVRPELVVEIALDGVQASVRYPGGVALRFARVRRYRPDKDASEVDLISSLQARLTRPS